MYSRFGLPSIEGDRCKAEVNKYQAWILPLNTYNIYLALFLASVHQPLTVLL